MKRPAVSQNNSQSASTWVADIALWYARPLSGYVNDSLIRRRIRSPPVVELLCTRPCMYDVLGIDPPRFFVGVALGIRRPCGRFLLEWYRQPRTVGDHMINFFARCRRLR